MQVHNVDIVIVNYRSEEDLARLVVTLRSIPGPELDLHAWVVDCGGSYLSLSESLGGSGMQVTIIDAGANIGFGPAANLGAAAGDGTTLAFVNPDIELDAAALGRVVRSGVADGAVAWTGVLRNSDGTIQRNAAPPPTLRQLASTYLLGLETRLPPAPAARQVAVLTGALLLVDRRTFDAVGGFDPEFPLYMEDVDLCRRLSASGAVVQYPDELGVHHGGRSAEHDRRATWTLLHASRVRYYGRGGRVRWVAAALTVLAGVTLRGLMRSPWTLPWIPGLARASSPRFPLAQLLPMNEVVAS